MTLSCEPSNTPSDLPPSSADQRAQASVCSLRRILCSSRLDKHAPTRGFAKLPQTTQGRRDASLNEEAIGIETSGERRIAELEEKGKTVLYLAYGSNLCNETFRGRRGIQPISQVNVIVPELRLTFDLPGIPYSEPCFANSAKRDPDTVAKHETYTESEGDLREQDYHKDRWHKGMVGCVYEVTPSDYAHIIATEGGGQAYKDIMVTCFPLPNDKDTVPVYPDTGAFKAHTLFAPSTTPPSQDLRTTERFSRPDPSYAQPSARYLKLITDGAAELALPSEYQTYLKNIRPYTVTSRKQALGQSFFAATWLPFITFLFALEAMFQDDKGKSPKWLGVLSGWIFLAMWKSYDVAYKKVFGDGERSEKQGEDVLV
ncbi:hypothetical protein P154DRAFT_520107 [Amniculicola lignicola CBS 123094]|uniref:gamma-glutamylcyclotransferase n=1 Tax=Amniculicola lignicola CBS 123094 TaxID=1392246 RepID=A0A6A5WRF8_9PLEO|nr:hypothetical protein P154DRAFT_520107 [Amniculicola lignicola CBS 123094]